MVHLLIAMLIIYTATVDESPILSISYHSSMETFCFLYKSNAGDIFVVCMHMCELKTVIFFVLFTLKLSS